MAGEDSVNNGGAVESSNCGARRMGNGVNCFPNGDGVACTDAGDRDSVGPASRTIHTYKRRKCGTMSLEPKLAQLEKLSRQLASQSQDEIVSADYSYQHWRSALQKLCQSFGADRDGTSGIECCIRDALFSNPQIDCVKVAKGECDSLEDPFHAQQASVPNSALTDIGSHSFVTSNGSVTELNDLIVTKQCQGALFRLIMSEKFMSLCKLLSENFHGSKFDKILDFSLLNSRMKEGTYERSPALFLSDIQQLWRKVHVIGTEMVSLSKSLAEMSRLFCREVGGGMEHGTLDGRKNEAFPWVSGWASRHEQPDDSLFKACTCRQCGEKSDGRDCLVCDSCEEMFHVSCIKPAITEIPLINWHCAHCSALGAESHENCVVCERLDAPAGTNEEAPIEMEESSSCIIENGIQVFKGSKRVCCKACKSTLESGELFRLCEHNACNHYYHVRCLTNKQLKSYCLRWYCPCCLCRVCLADKDDDKIVLCDACDHAYHIYCMNPPQKTIPEGQWYCRKCDAGLQAIHKAKLAYKSLETKENKKLEKKKGSHNSSGRKSAQLVRKDVDRSGGVDMLLSAANAISHQEQLAARNNNG